MSSFNKCIFMGHLVRDPEVRSTQGGNSVCSFTLAMNDKYKSKSGEMIEDVCFIEVAIWGPRGEAFAKYHRKGQSAFVEGKLKLSKWEDKEGNKRSKHSLTAFGWEFVGSGDKGGMRGEQPQDLTYAPKDDVPVIPYDSGKGSDFLAADDTPF